MGCETSQKITVFDTDLDAFVAYLRRVVEAVSKLVYRQVLGIHRQTNVFWHPLESAVKPISAYCASIFLTGVAAV